MTKANVVTLNRKMHQKNLEQVEMPKRKEHPRDVLNIFFFLII